MLVTLIFSIPTLKWGPEFELDHLELFAGDCAVTRGEVKDVYSLCRNDILGGGTVFTMQYVIFVSYMYIYIYYICLYIYIYMYIQLYICKYILRHKNIVHIQIYIYICIVLCIYIYFWRVPALLPPTKMRRKGAELWQWIWIMIHPLWIWWTQKVSFQHVTMRHAWSRALEPSLHQCVPHSYSCHPEQPTSLLFCVIPKCYMLRCCGCSENLQ